MYRFKGFVRMEKDGNDGMRVNVGLTWYKIFQTRVGEHRVYVMTDDGRVLVKVTVKDDGPLLFSVDDSAVEVHSEDGALLAEFDGVDIAIDEHEGILEVKLESKNGDVFKYQTGA